MAARVNYLTVSTAALQSSRVKLYKKVFDIDGTHAQFNILLDGIPIMIPG